MGSFIEPGPGGQDYMKALGGGGKEMATVRIEATGQVTVYTAQSPHGQSHETTLAQVVASELGVPFESIKALHGDTQSAPFSMIGTGGSRAATMARGAALFATREVNKQMLSIARPVLEASPDDLEIASSTISVRGVPQKAIPLAQIAMLVYLAPGHLPPDSPS